jgi:hypothetical protein
MSFDTELKNALKKGKIRKTMADKVDIKLPRILIHSLQWVSVGYSSALYFAGKRLGKEVLAKDIKGNNIKNLLKEIGGFFSKIGIGKMEIVEAGNNKSIVHLKECSTCYHMESIGKTVCFFEAGLIAGILEGKLNKNVTVNETVCGGLGDEIDEFTIKIG